MKFLNFFLLSSLLILSASCNKDDDDDPCVADNLEETIVGKWTITESGSTLGDVEFKSDGTLIDTEDVLIGFEDVSDEKSYVVDSNSEFTATAEHDGSSIEFGYDVTSFACDEIILDVFGFEVIMARK